MTAGAASAPVAASTPAREGARWPWALVLVACCHLLTTSGTWAVLDHGEILYTARHVLHHGTFDLTASGVPRLEFMPTVTARPGQPVRSRFLPVPTLTLIPLLALDEALGWGDEREFGHLVHLQGHLFVMAGLALLGAGLRRTGASDAGAAMGVLLAGLSWPVWLVSRRVGPEPVMIFLVCLFLYAQSRPRRARTALEGLVCVVFPWSHATGALMSMALAASLAADALVLDDVDARRSRAREAAVVAALAALGTATMLYFWNHLFHGDWMRGGYALYPQQTLGNRSLLEGVVQHLGSLALDAPVTILLAVAGWWAARRGADGTASAAAPSAATPARAVTTTYAITAVLSTGALVLFFATFFSPEPTRRLAVACPLWAGVAGASWDRLRLAPPWPQALVAAAGLVGFAWFIEVDGAWQVSAGGWNLPQYVLWADLLRAGRPWAAAVPVLMLLALGAVAASRVWMLLGSRGLPARFARVAAAL